jgi:hypothetical protein
MVTHDNRVGDEKVLVRGDLYRVAPMDGMEGSEDVSKTLGEVESIVKEDQFLIHTDRQKRIDEVEVESIVKEEQFLIHEDSQKYIDEVEVCVLCENLLVHMPVNPWDVFSRLWKLDLSRNKLRNLQGFRSLSVIGSLNLSKNYLDFSAVADLRNTVILNLEIEENPLISRHAQSMLILSFSHSLIHSSTHPLIHSSTH